MASPGEEIGSLDFAKMIGGPLVAVVDAQSQAAISSVNFIKQVGFKSAGTEQTPETQQTGDPIYVSFRYPKEIAPYRPAVGTGDGSIALAVASGGSGYAVAPSVEIDPPPDGGTPAAFTATVQGGVVTAFVPTSAGTGYTSAPGVRIVPAGGDAGTGAAASVTANTAAQDAKIQQMQLEVPILTLLPIPFIRVESTTIDFNAKINSVEYTRTDQSVKVDGELEAKIGVAWASARLKVSASYQKTSQSGTNVERTYTMAVHVSAVQDEMPAGMERMLGILEDAIKAQPAAPTPAPA